MSLLVAMESALYAIVMKFHSTDGDSTVLIAPLLIALALVALVRCFPKKLAPAEKIAQTCLPLFASLVKMAL